MFATPESLARLKRSAAGLAVLDADAVALGRRANLPRTATTSAYSATLMTGTYALAGADIG